MFGDDISMSVTYPETNKLFKVREDDKQLSEKKGELFHSVVAELLFMMKRSRPDLDTSMDFLTTRVLKSDVDDWGKLRKILRGGSLHPQGKNIFWRDEFRQDLNMGGCIICSKP